MLYWKILFISWKDSEERPFYCYFPQQRRRIYLFNEISLTTVYHDFSCLIVFHASLHFFFSCHIWHPFHATFSFLFTCYLLQFLERLYLLFLRHTTPKTDLIFFRYMLFYIFLWMWPNIYSQSSKAAYGSLSKVA